MIRFKLKVTNKNKNSVERIQDYTFEPEMFLQGLIKAFVLLELIVRYYNEKVLLIHKSVANCEWSLRVSKQLFKEVFYF